MIYGEKMMLPDDTLIRRQMYKRPKDADSMVAGITLSGADRSSIHHPETCMTSQGNRIEHSELIEVNIPDRPPLQVRVLDLTFEQTGMPTIYRFYAYWFSDGQRETAAQWQRMKMMVLDRVLRNRSRRLGLPAADRTPRTGQSETCGTDS